MIFFASPMGPLGRSALLPPLRVCGGAMQMGRRGAPRAAMSMAVGGVGRPIGFIGLGVMGLPMAANLVNKMGAELVVWNRTASRCDELASAVKAGAVRSVDTPAEVVDACDVTFSMLSTPTAARVVLHDGAGAAFSALKAGKSFVDCSTLTVDDMTATHKAAADVGATFLEAPVSGSKGPAEQGSLLFLCGGDREVFDMVEKPLSVMGKRSFYLGPTGSGTRMKLVVNSVMGAMLASLAEGIALTEACDMSVDDLLTILDGGAMANPMFKLKGPNMDARKRSYATNFPLEHALKDMRFAQRLAGELDVQMPVASSATELYENADKNGLGRQDFAAVMESVRDLAAQGK